MSGSILSEAFNDDVVRRHIPTAPIPYGTETSISAAQPVDYVLFRYAPFADSSDTIPGRPKHRGIICVNCEKQGVDVYLYNDQEAEQHVDIHGAVLREERKR